MRDETPQELHRRTTARDILQAHLSAHGYRAIDTPLLEPTELFLRKSGGELATRMYTFNDPGGNRVSLRPEFTPSVIRYYLERAGEEPLPLRLQYSGPVFRYDEAGRFNQAHQAGAEVIGAASPDSDGEMLALAMDGLSRLGAPSPQCVVGHVGVLHLMLGELGISSRAQEFLIGCLPGLRASSVNAADVLEQARSRGLVKGEDGSRAPVLPTNGGGRQDAIDALRHLFHDSLSGIQGSRSTDEILARFMSKQEQGDDPASVERGVSLLSRVASSAGDEEQAMSRLASALREHGIGRECLSPLEEALAAFHIRRPDTPVMVDVGLVRGIAYYTGMVFEIRAGGSGSEVAVCGGGRYDGLVKAIGGLEDVPALGFAYTLENLLGLLPEDAPRSLEESHSAPGYSQRR
ncbi:MAG: HisS family protein [Chloroflexota bacterium]|nr:HisS family protein [Chloroflexota bacterium]MDE2941902.1 HisS family protein [Chloroflexota bacterium]MDE3268373.1 HisS family protein [Chloroflexota bacterium]